MTDITEFESPDVNGGGIVDHCGGRKVYHLA